MTPQERDLVSDLFDRLAKLETAPRDPEAEQLIGSSLGKAPNALYALTQSVLVQDEALKQANARIRDLEGGDVSQDDNHPKGFLDSMRDALFGGGRDDRRGSVPSVRPGDQPAGAPQYRTGAPWGTTQAPPQQYAPPQQQYAPQQDYGRGGGSSFLGTAAAAAAGMIGGSLLLGGIRNALGGSNQGAFSGTFDQISNNPSNAASSPWNGSTDGGDLSRQAGLNDIGGSGRQASNDDMGGRQGAFDAASNDDSGLDDGDFNDDGGGYDGGSDTA